MEEDKVEEELVEKGLEEKQEGGKGIVKAIPPNLLRLGILANFI